MVSRKLVFADDIPTPNSRKRALPRGGKNHQAENEFYLAQVKLVFEGAGGPGTRILLAFCGAVFRVMCAYEDNGYETSIGDFCFFA